MRRLTQTTTTYSFLTSRNLSVSYTYDAASNRASMTDAESGLTTYAYDTLNRLTNLTNFQDQPLLFSYDALSRRTQITRANGLNTAYSYDTLSRLLSVAHQRNGTTLSGATYTYDNAGNRLTRGDLFGNTTLNYSYDAIYQLTQATQDTATKESYTYDAVGNSGFGPRPVGATPVPGVRWTPPQSTHRTGVEKADRLSSLGLSPYAYNSSNELTSTPSATYTYDNNGNTLTKVAGSSTTSYAWDPSTTLRAGFENSGFGPRPVGATGVLKSDRLTSVTLPGTGGTVTFKYDPFGRRIYKSSSSGTSIYVYDGDNQIEEVNATGGVVARYTQGLGIDEPLALLRSGVTSYYHADGLGPVCGLRWSPPDSRNRRSINALSSTAGVLNEVYLYDSFGNITVMDGSVANPFRYTGRDFDSETGLYNYRARYYDPTVGRFLNEDRLEFAGDSPSRFTVNISANPSRKLAAAPGCSRSSAIISRCNHTSHTRLPKCKRKPVKQILQGAPEMIRAEDTQVVGAFERRRVGRVAVAHAAAHLPDGFVLVILHPPNQL